MSVGFICYNDNGSVQFDTELVTYYLYAKGTQTTDSSIGTFGPGATIYDAGQEANEVYYGPLASGSDSIPISAAGDIIAFSSMNNLIGSYSSDGVYQTYGISTTVGAVINWYQFRPYSALAPSAHGVGMQLFDSAGTLLYDAVAAKPLRVYDTYTVPSMVSGLNDFHALPSSKTFAFIIANPSVRQTVNNAGVNPTFNLITNTWQPAPNGRTSGVFQQTGTNGFWIKEMKNNVYTVGDQNIGKIVAVDVTGY